MPEQVQGQLRAISGGVKCVRNSKAMPQLLSLVLKLGNVLNTGSARANAKGFRLEVLLISPALGGSRAISPWPRPSSPWPRPISRQVLLKLAETKTTITDIRCCNRPS